MPESDDEDLEDGSNDDREDDEAYFDVSVSPSSRKRRKETADGPQKRPRTDEDVGYSFYSTHSRIHYLSIIATQGHYGGMGSIQPTA